MSNISKFITRLLPDFFHRYDSYKNDNQEGLLVRFLETIGEDIDTNLVPKLENFLDIKEVEITEAKFLDYLAEFYGNPPDILSEEEYRSLLKYITTLYKIKGTIKAFEVYFSLLGLTVKVSEYWVTPSIYDEFNYDDPDKNYDQDGCEPCSEYEILFWDKTVDCTNPTISTLDKTLLDKLHQIVFLNEPINAKLRDFIYTVPLCDQVRFCIDERIDWDKLKPSKYDEMDFDDTAKYDEYVSIGTGFAEGTNCAILAEMTSAEVTTAATSSLNLQGLLDAHTGGVRAWGLRYLKDSTTNVVKARRTSDQVERYLTPVDIYGTEMMDWAEGSTVTVVELLDQLGNVDYKFSVPSKQPVLVDNGVKVTSGGKPSMRIRADVLSTMLASNNDATLDSGVSILAVYTPLQGYGEDNSNQLAAIADTSSHPDGEMVFGLSVDTGDAIITLDGHVLSRVSSTGSSVGPRRFVANSIDTDFIINNISTSTLTSGPAKQAASDSIPVEILEDGNTISHQYTPDRLADPDLLATRHNSANPQDYASFLLDELIIFPRKLSHSDLVTIQSKQQAYF